MWCEHWSFGICTEKSDFKRWSAERFQLLLTWFERHLTNGVNKLFLRFFHNLHGPEHWLAQKKWNTRKFRGARHARIWSTWSTSAPRKTLCRSIFHRR